MNNYEYAVSVNKVTKKIKIDKNNLKPVILSSIKYLLIALTLVIIVVNISKVFSINRFGFVIGSSIVLIIFIFFYGLREIEYLKIYQLLIKEEKLTIDEEDKQVILNIDFKKYATYVILNSLMMTLGGILALVILHFIF